MLVNAILQSKSEYIVKCMPRSAEVSAAAWDGNGDRTGQEFRERLNERKNLSPSY